MEQRFALMALTAISIVTILLQTGCAQQCKQVKSNYTQALNKEGSLVEEVPKTPTTHIGLGVRTNLIGDVAVKLLSAQLKDALLMTTKVPLGAGKVIDVDMRGQTLNLKFVQDSACKTCFRLGGNLGGSVAVNIPLFGRKNIPLNGSLKLIAPIVFETLKNNTIRIKLDTQKFAQYAKDAINLNLKGLPSSWATALRQPLTNKIIAHLTAKLKPMNLFSFQSPDLGIAGLKILPAEIGYHPKQQAFFLGFNTNLPGIENGQGLTSTEAMNFSTKENLAVAIHPNIILNAVTLLMKSGKIPRRYTTDGKASESGPAHVTLNNFNIGKTLSIGAKGSSSTNDASGKADAAGNDMSLGFRSWNLLGAACFWFDAIVAGDISLVNSVLEIKLTDIKIVDSSAPALIKNLIKNLVGWKQADFLNKTQQLLKTTLSKPSINIPGATLNLAISTLARDSKTLVLKSNVSMK